MLLRKLVVVGLVGFASLAANIATAEDAGAPTSFVAVEGVDLADPADAFSNRFQFRVGDGQTPRFSALGPVDTRAGNGRDTRYEFEFVASGRSGIDVSFAQRGGVGFNASGDLERESRGSELRLGRGLGDMDREDAPSAEPRWYFFAASEDEALVWRPGTRNEFGGSGSSFTLQDRVEIGDLQVGVTYERHGIQASLAYVEREISVRTVGIQGAKQDENFAGFTLTMRH
jgi:hypothetical protein